MHFDLEIWNCSTYGISLSGWGWRAAPTNACNCCVTQRAQPCVLNWSIRGQNRPSLPAAWKVGNVLSEQHEQRWAEVSLFSYSREGWQQWAENKCSLKHVCCSTADLCWSQKKKKKPQRSGRDRKGFSLIWAEPMEGAVCGSPGFTGRWCWLRKPHFTLHLLSAIQCRGKEMKRALSFAWFPWKM